RELLRVDQLQIDQRTRHAFEPLAAVIGGKVRQKFLPRRDRCFSRGTRRLHPRELELQQLDTLAVRHVSHDSEHERASAYALNRAERQLDPDVLAQPRAGWYFDGSARVDDQPVPEAAVTLEPGLVHAADATVHQDFDRLTQRLFL